ncbi:PGPGW domain-containing protein [Geobacter sp. DSM 9736]|uniref:PGPGW domain-containing protein n=1 Tax=Geobacter sp. DSM 9736 TaxID=1277350 RepID=UPI000B505C36|nr:PGPGW domain-containing protein [Geobacter sp. DSM 9736]
MVASTLRKAKRIVVAAAGFIVLGVGVAMIVLPGPAIAVIPVGLGILATEFVWAKSLLKLVKERLCSLRAHKGQPLHEPEA